MDCRKLLLIPVAASLCWMMAEAALTVRHARSAAIARAIEIAYGALRP